MPKKADDYPQPAEKEVIVTTLEARKELRFRVNITPHVQANMTDFREAWDQVVEAIRAADSGGRWAAMPEITVYECRVEHDGHSEGCKSWEISVGL